MTSIIGYYINLENRGDRREHFENLKKSWPFLSRIKKIVAIENSDPAYGCCLSHLRALAGLSISDEPYVAVFEDDFCILNEENFRGFIQGFETIKDDPDWDVVVLTPRGTTIRPLLEDGGCKMEMSGFRRIIDHQTATGYIVKKEFLKILIENLAQAAKMQEEGVDKNISANDQYWKRLQMNSRFYYYSGIFGGQLPSWSNIENQWVDYNQRFRDQINY
jgi:GR25 family glycosyltransferase involved in LPS biosynthesis